MRNSATLAIVLSLLYGCSGGTQTNSAENEIDGSVAAEDTKMEPVNSPAVCIWDQISVREEPNSKGKWKTSINLGESLTFLGIVAIDSTSDNKREYAKVQLADGTEGWALNDFILPDGKGAAFKIQTDIYKRPDLLTKTDKQYEAMDIVGVVREKDDWSEVKGRIFGTNFVSSGWVKSANLTSGAIDIAVAKFGQSALEEDDDEAMSKAIREILDNSDLEGSLFISILQKKLDDVTYGKGLTESIIENDSVK